jgi:hypothetical protein
MGFFIKESLGKVMELLLSADLKIYLTIFYAVSAAMACDGGKRVDRCDRINNPALRQMKLMPFEMRSLS